MCEKRKSTSLSTIQVKGRRNKSILKLNVMIQLESRSQWPRGLRRRSTAARLLRSWVRIPPGTWMFVCCECCVLSGRGLCDELITRPEESYRLWCVAVCDIETSSMRSQTSIVTELTRSPRWRGPHHASESTSYKQPTINIIYMLKVVNNTTRYRKNVYSRY